ncbi:MAG: TIGR04372 family glycosyltransferase [Verrucomicrobiota bacterium]
MKNSLFVTAKLEEIVRQRGLTSQRQTIQERRLATAELWQSAFRRRIFLMYHEDALSKKNFLTTPLEELETLFDSERCVLPQVKFCTLCRLLLKKMTASIGKKIYYIRYPFIRRHASLRAQKNIYQAFEEKNYEAVYLQCLHSITPRSPLHVLQSIRDRVFQTQCSTFQEREWMMQICFFLMNALIGKDVESARALFEHALAVYPDRAELMTQGISDAAAGIIMAYSLVGEKKQYVRLSALQMNLQAEHAKRHGLDFSGRVYLNSVFSTTIGYIANLGLFAKLQLLMNSEVKGVLLLNVSKIANMCFLGYLEPFFEMISNPQDVRRMENMIDRKPFVSVVPIHGEWMDYYDAFEWIQDRWETQGREPLLRLTDEDREFGWNELNKVGIPKYSWFVGAHVRESGFYHQSERNGSNHFNIERNADIMSYLPAFEEIVRRGGYVIRVGDSSMTPLPRMQGVFDYANSPIKSDRMDIFLMSACRWFMATNSGPFAVPGLFGVRSLHTNFLPLGNNIGYRHDMLLPRLIRNRKTKKLFTFREIMTSCLGNAQSMQYVKEFDAEYLPNTPEEILEATRNMLQYMESNFSKQAFSSDLQKRFQDLCRETQFRVSPIMTESFLSKWEKLIS